MRKRHPEGATESSPSLAPSQTFHSQQQSNENHNDTIELRRLDPAVLRPENLAVSEDSSAQRSPNRTHEPVSSSIIKRAWDRLDFAASVPLEASRDYTGRCYISLFLSRVSGFTCGAVGPRLGPSLSNTPISVWARILKRVALERTFLSYVRTSVSFAIFGVAAAQLFRLEGSLDASEISTFYRLGKPIGALAEGVAILIVLFGAYRCLSQQHKMLAGHIRARGWELWSIGGLAFAVSMSWASVLRQARLTVYQVFCTILAFLAGDSASGKGY